MVNLFTAKEPRIYNGEKTVPSMNSIKETGTQAKEWNWATLSYIIHKNCQNGLEMNIRYETKLLEENIKLLEENMMGR